MHDPEFQQKLLATFRGEAHDHWRAISSGLFELEQSTDPAGRPAIVETIFREAHTLKGAARLVGDDRSVSLCQRLEEIFSRLKFQKLGPAPHEFEALHTMAAELRLVLQLEETAPATLSATAPALAVPAFAATDEPARTTLVRVPVERLDSLLLQAEEMVSLKMTGAERLAALVELGTRTAAWRKRWTKLKPHLAAARRFVDQNRHNPASRQLTEILQFLEWNDDFLGHLRSDVTTLSQSASREQGWLGGAIDGLLDRTKEILVQPSGTLLEIFPAFVRDTAREQGKEVDLILDGADTEVDRRVLDEIKDAVIHLVRNAIDHGIETPDERKRAGKPRRARFRLAIEEKSGGNVELSIADDGRGITVERVKAAAVERGLMDRNAELTESDALNLLFESGFSTAGTVTELSGRGLGLAIVKEKVSRLGGSVSVETKPGEGTTFRLLLPITLARFRGVFVQAGGRPYVIPTSHVRHIVNLKKARQRRVKNQDTLEFEGAPIPLLALVDALGMPAATDAKTDFAVIIGSGRSRVACKVEGIPYDHEIMMKNLGRLLPRIRFVAGATIVGAGQVVPVLNADDLLRATIERAPVARLSTSAKRAAPQRKRRILVVEDSITSRSLFRSILQGAGYEVRTAVDGVEGLSLLKVEPFDLVMSDVQMPRMDGISLTQKIRAEPTLSTLPVILITSLASREDKERGVDAGANAYVVKSSFDQSDLLHTLGRLLS
jgi:two-component system chemotaxis sensor kinase CheA